MLGEHQGDWSFESGIAAAAHSREKDELLLLHVRREFAQQSLEPASKSDRRRGVVAMDRLDASCEADQLGQFAPVAS